MVKKIICSFLGILAVASVAQAAKLNVMDTPTTEILNYGSYNVGFRFFGNGGVTTKLDFGVFKILNVGVSWELDNFLGNEQIKVAIPTLSVKIKLYDGNMTWPGIALGYDGQGYFYNTDFDGDFMQRCRGLYVVFGREMILEGLMVDLGVNMNNFKEPKAYAFFNAIVPVYKEDVYFMAEYDNLHSFSDARLNAGVRLALSESVDLDFMMRDCWGSNGTGRMPNERVFKLTYSGKF